MSAACAGLPPERFFEAPFVADGDAEWTDAGPEFETTQRVCLGCDVRATCLMAGLREPFGIWGGLAPKERKRLRRKLGQTLPWKPTVDDLEDWLRLGRVVVPQ